MLHNLTALYDYLIQEPLCSILVFYHVDSNFMYQLFLLLFIVIKIRIVHTRIKK